MCRQGTLDCLCDARWLNQQLIVVWRDRCEAGLAGTRSSSNLTLATECFLTIAQDCSSGGQSDCDPENPRYAALLHCWYSAVMTTVAMTMGAISQADRNLDYVHDTIPEDGMNRR